MPPELSGGPTKIEAALHTLARRIRRNGRTKFEIDADALRACATTLQMRDQLVFMHVDAFGGAIDAAPIKRFFAAAKNVSHLVCGLRTGDDEDRGLHFTWRNAQYRPGRLHFEFWGPDPKRRQYLVPDVTDAYVPPEPPPPKEKKPRFKPSPPPAPPPGWSPAPYNRNAFTYQNKEGRIYRVEAINAYAWRAWFLDDGEVRTLPQTRDVLDAWVLVESYDKEPFALESYLPSQRAARRR